MDELLTPQDFESDEDWIDYVESLNHEDASEEY